MTLPRLLPAPSRASTTCSRPPLEFLQNDRKFLNYGYTVSGKETYEERQQQLCLEVFQAAEIGQCVATVTGAS